MSYLGSPMQITVDGLTFNEVDSAGCEWSFEDITGWYDGPGVQSAQVQRVVSHGQFPQASHRTGRTISVTGGLRSTTRGPVAAAVNQLTGLLADGGFDTFTVVDDDDGTLWVDVQLLDSPQIQWIESNLVRFQLQFLAADSYRYGEVSTASTGFGMDPVGAGLVFPLFGTPSTLDFGPQGTTGSLTVSDTGTAPASVSFTVTGPTPDGGFVITDAATGKTITFLGSVPAGSTLVLDGADGSVTIDGSASADRSGDTIVQAWPTLGGGESRDFTFTSLGGSTASVLTAEVVATYW